MAGRRVAIIGAGITGLTAGYELQKAGFEVVVLERASYAGGRMGNVDVGSPTLRLDTGAEVLFDFYSDMLELIRELGIEDHVVWIADSGEYMSTNGEVDYKIGWSSVREVLGERIIGWGTKLRLVAFLFDLWRARRQIDPNLLQTAVAFDNESAHDYLVRKVGRDFLEFYVDPIYRGAGGWSSERSSKAYFLAFFAHTLTARNFVFDEGIGLLCRTLAERLDVRLGARAERIARGTDGRWQVHYSDGSQESRELCADSVVCTTPAGISRELVEGLAPWQDDFLESVRYYPVGIVHYVLRRSPPRFFRVFSRHHPSPFALYQQEPGDPSHHGDPPRLYCELKPEVVAGIRNRVHAPEPGHVVGRDKVLDEAARAGARAFYPELDTDLVEVHTQWMDPMLPEFHPGYIRSLAAFLERQESEGGDLVLCGDYLAHATTGAACALARRVARHAARNWAVDTRV